MRIEVSIAKTTALPNGALEALNNELSRRIAEQFPAIDSQVSVRYEMCIRDSLSAVSAKPGAVMVITHGAASIPITVTIARARVSSPETYETNTRVASSPCLLLYSARIGTNACEKAPSAKIRRSRLGSLKAVSYTHLDVYKRQALRSPPLSAWRAAIWY